MQEIVDIYLDGVGRRRFSAGWTLFSKLLAPLFLATYSSGSAITRGIIKVFKAEHKAGGPLDMQEWLQGQDD